MLTASPLSAPRDARADPGRGPATALLAAGELDISDGGDQADAALLESRVVAMAARLAEFGLTPGECLLIIAGARVSTLVGLLAAFRRGLDVALAPIGAPVEALAAYAARVGARAVAGQGAIGDYPAIDDLMQVAAMSPEARFVAHLDDAAYDGAVSLAGLPRSFAPAPDPRPTRLATFAPGGAVIYHDQSALALSALDLAMIAGVRAGDTIVSTLAPTGFAGLVAGPCLAMTAHARLHYVQPFDAATFVDSLLSRAPAHLIAPGALAGPLAEAGLLRPELLASLMLVDRTGEGRGALAPLGDTGGVPVIDLHAFGEQALIAERRGSGGRPRPPAREPHLVNLDGRVIVAARRREGPGPLVFEGEAISAPPS